MIRLITTVVIALIIVSGGLAVYRDAGGGLDGVLGGLVRTRSTPTATATPDLCPPALKPCAGPGVDVPNGAAGPATPTPLSVPAVSTSAPAPAQGTMTLAEGQAVVAQQGYTTLQPYAGPCSTASPCADAGSKLVATAWCSTCPLHVIIGVSTPSADGYNRRAFFFTDRYLGTDAATPSSDLSFDTRDLDTVTLFYGHYVAPDRGVTVKVRFRWDGTRLVALDPIPDHRQSWAPPASAPAPAANGPSTADCAWAVATLREDAQLDLYGIQNYPGTRDWYTETAAWWDQIGGWLSASCAPPWPPAQCSTANDHLTQARNLHVQAAPNMVPGPGVSPQQAAINANFNQTWIDNYTKLLAVVGALCA